MPYFLTLELLPSFVVFNSLFNSLTIDGTEVLNIGRYGIEVTLKDGNRNYPCLDQTVNITISIVNNPPVFEGALEED